MSMFVQAGWEDLTERSWKHARHGQHCPSYWTIVERTRRAYPAQQGQSRETGGDAETGESDTGE